MSSIIIIATRQSPLALCQADYIKARLLAYHPTLTVELLGLTTVADQRLDVTLNRIGGKGLFVKELEEALLDKRADIAVHSMKDVPMTLPPGLILPVMTTREDPRDAFISNHYSSIDALPKGARVGTASLRRQTQLRHLRPDLTLLPLRGNIQTRLKRLDQGDFDAIVLASAGLHRAGMQNRITQYIDVVDSLPAAGQGALGIECRQDDERMLSFIQSLHDEKTASCVLAERELCRLLEGGCQVPIGAYAIWQEEMIYLRGLIANADGSIIIRSEARGDDPILLGKLVANGLLQQGARTLLDAFK